MTRAAEGASVVDNDGAGGGDAVAMAVCVIPLTPWVAGYRGTAGTTPRGPLIFGPRV